MCVIGFEQFGTGDNMMCSRDKLPNYVDRGKSASIGNVTLEDRIWIGATGEVDPDAILEQHGYDPAEPLATVLMAIINGNPIDGRGAAERLETALSALIGTPRKPGMDELDSDYELLTEIARKYFRHFHQNGHVEPQLSKIIKDVLAAVPKGDARILADPDSVVRRLRRKFNANKNVLLVRATSKQNWERMDVLRSVEAVLKRLRALGVSVA